MDIKGFLSGALDAVGMFVPGVAAAAKVVNSLLPEGKQLDLENSTGKQVLEAYADLDAHDREYVEEQFKLEMAEINASVDKLQAMVSAETATANMRPRIAYMMAWAVLIAVIFMMFIWGKAVWSKDAGSLEQLAESWPLMLAILGTPTALLRAYFGMRTKEKQSRYAAATGQPIAQAVGGLANIFKR